jgi:hypothetical protein
MNNLVKLFPQDAHGNRRRPQDWIGRIAIFELSTGTRVQGRILGVSDPWIDTDNGAVNANHIVHAKWVSDEEARIIRGGPLDSHSLSGLPFDPSKRFG